MALFLSESYSNGNTYDVVGSMEEAVMLTYGTHVQLQEGEIALLQADFIIHEQSSYLSESEQEKKKGNFITNAIKMVIDFIKKVFNAIRRALGFVIRKMMELVGRDKKTVVIPAGIALALKDFTEKGVNNLVKAIHETPKGEDVVEVPDLIKQKCKIVKDACDKIGGEVEKGQHSVLQVKLTEEQTMKVGIFVKAAEALRVLSISNLPIYEKFLEKAKQVNEEISKLDAEEVTSQIISAANDAMQCIPSVVRNQVKELIDSKRAEATEILSKVQQGIATGVSVVKELVATISKVTTTITSVSGIINKYAKHGWADHVTVGNAGKMISDELAAKAAKEKSNSETE